MSLLGTQVYANSAQPCWLSAVGGTITSLDIVDNLEVGGTTTLDGNLEIGGTTQSTDEFRSSGGGYVIQDVTQSFLYGRFTADSNSAYIETPSNLKFTQMGQTTGNTQLVVSAAGSGLDSFTTNFLYAVGPVPVPVIPVGANPTFDLIAGSGSRTDTFAITTPYPLVAGQVYDIQATGIVTWTAGPAPSAADLVTVAVQVGSTTVSEATALYYPGDAPTVWVINVGNNFNLRARLPASGSVPPNPVVQVSFLGNAATGTISAICNYMSITRVA